MGLHGRADGGNRAQYGLPDTADAVSTLRMPIWHGVQCGIVFTKIFQNVIRNVLNNLGNVIDINQQSPAANSFVIVFSIKLCPTRTACEAKVCRKLFISLVIDPL